MRAAPPTKVAQLLSVTHTRRDSATLPDHRPVMTFYFQRPGRRLRSRKRPDPRARGEHQSRTGPSIKPCTAMRMLITGTRRFSHPGSSSIIRGVELGSGPSTPPANGLSAITAITTHHLTRSRGAWSQRHHDAQDSAGFLSWTINRRASSPASRRPHCLIWIRPQLLQGRQGRLHWTAHCTRCTGRRLCRLTAYHIRIPPGHRRLAEEGCNTTPCAA